MGEVVVSVVALGVVQALAVSAEVVSVVVAPPEDSRRFHADVCDEGLT